MSARQYWQASTLVLAITLTFALLVAPLVTEAQVARKVYRLRHTLGDGGPRTRPLPLRWSRQRQPSVNLVH